MDDPKENTLIHDAYIARVSKIVLYEHIDMICTEFRPLSQESYEIFAHTKTQMMCIPYPTQDNSELYQLVRLVFAATIIPTTNVNRAGIFEILHVASEFGTYCNLCTQIENNRDYYRMKNYVCKHSSLVIGLSSLIYVLIGVKDTEALALCTELGLFKMLKYNTILCSGLNNILYGLSTTRDTLSHQMILMLTEASVKPNPCFESSKRTLDTCSCVATDYKRVVIHMLGIAKKSPTYRQFRNAFEVIARTLYQRRIVNCADIIAEL